MPYIVTTRAVKRDTLYDESLSGMPGAIQTHTLPALTRIAVATDYAMRAAVRDHVVAAGVPHGTTADPVTDAGGTIGPLPDGTMIEVQRVDTGALEDELHPSSIAYDATPLDIIAAFNAAQ